MQDFIDNAFRACAQNAQAAGCANSERDAARAAGVRRPTDEWMRDVASKTDASEVYGCVIGMVSSGLAVLKKTRAIRAGARLDVAIDMHLIPRYDKKKRSELARSKHRDGTSRFERYMTMQCVAAGCRLVLGIVYVPALSDMEVCVRRLVEMARKAGVRIGTATLDREFFSRHVIGELNDLDVDFIMPCRATTTTAASIREYASGSRGSASGSLIKSSDGVTADYTMIIADRRSKEEGETDPEKRYIGFAASRPGIDPRIYDRRWGIETGYRMIENARARTHSKNPAARILYFALSCMFFNAWVLACAMFAHTARLHAEALCITQQAFKDAIVRCLISYCMMRPEPPPPPCLP